jgi:formamidopyrimidine-DNA glycosylase
MPELPEVETVMCGLLPAMLGDQIERVKLYRKDLRVPFPKGMQKTLAEQRITALTRRAKYILVSFANGKILVIHLGMSGRVSIVPHGEEYALQKHDHMVLTMSSGIRIIYNDPRRFGMVFIIKDGERETHKAFCHLGPEPLGNDFSAPYLLEVLGNKKTAIKQALLDQRVVVGVGNIYACEALYRAKINPSKPANKLTVDKAEELVKAIRFILRKAIKAGGSTLKDYRHADGELGYFQRR